MSFFKQGDCIFPIWKSPVYESNRTKEYFDLKNNIEKWLSSHYVNDSFDTNRDYCCYQYNTIISILNRERCKLIDEVEFKNDLIFFIYSLCYKY